jgi:NAD(P)-dependent dehydrogenase (short-subunit alcohol dehydrogenase family)
MSSASFTGRVAVITGGTRGIGKAVALALAAQGASVVVCSRTAEEQEWPADLVTVGPAATGEFVALRADVGCPDDLSRLVDRTMARFGRLDILVNNAVVVPQVGPLLEADLPAWNTSLDAGVRAAFLLSKAAVETWMSTNGGSIVNVASIAGLRGSDVGLGLYGLAKASLIYLTRQLARELGPQGIRVNAVAPGVIQTDLSRPLWDTPDAPAPLLGRNPRRPFGTPEDVAAAVSFLASDAAAYVNGEVLVVDGGATA